MLRVFLFSPVETVKFKIASSLEKLKTCLETRSLKCCKKNLFTTPFNLKSYFQYLKFSTHQYIPTKMFKNRSKAWTKALSLFFLGWHIALLTYLSNKIFLVFLFLLDSAANQILGHSASQFFFLGKRSQRTYSKTNFSDG